LELDLLAHEVLTPDYYAELPRCEGSRLLCALGFEEGCAIGQQRMVPGGLFSCLL
jgi:hypothetical protein